jgi:hypothetical protein
VSVPVLRDPLEVEAAVPWLQLLVISAKVVPCYPDFRVLALIAKMLLSMLLLRIPEEVGVALVVYLAA